MTEAGKKVTKGGETKGKFQENTGISYKVDFPLIETKTEFCMASQMSKKPPNNPQNTKVQNTMGTISHPIILDLDDDEGKIRGNPMEKKSESLPSNSAANNFSTTDFYEDDDLLEV